MVKAMHNSILDPNYGLIYQINDKNVLNLEINPFTVLGSEEERDMASESPKKEEMWQNNSFQGYLD